MAEDDERLRQAIRVGTIGIFDHDHATDVIFWSLELRQMYGWDPDEPVTIPKIVAQVHPEDAGRVIEALKRAHNPAGDGLFDIEHRITDRGGRLRWVMTRSRTQFGTIAGKRSPIRTIGASMDVTERRTADERLRVLDTVLSSSAQAIAITDPNGTLTFANAALQHLWGYSDREPLVGRSLFDLWKTADESAAAAMVHIKDTRLQRVEVPVTRVDGSPFHLGITTEAVCDVNGALKQVLVTFSDITERKRLEEQLAQAQKMESVGRLAGGIAHDFNNLLTVVSAGLELSLETLAPDHPSRSYLSEVADAAQSTAALTRQLLAFSRKEIIAPTVLDLNEIIRRTEKMIQRLIGADIELHTICGKDLTPIRFDPGQVEQVLVNLVVNGRDAMPTGGRLTIETSNVWLDQESAARHVGVRPGAYALLAVSDTGAGMSDEVRAHLFEPFFTTKGPGQGTGLGLAMVYGAVQQNGGCIEVFSAPDQGTTFKIYLPATHRVEQAPPAPAPAAPRTRSATILLVEDDPRVRRVANDALARSGYDVHPFANGDDALRGLASISPAPELLISDVIMPGMNGRVLAERIAAVFPDIRILFVSGYTESFIVDRGVLKAGIEFLAKPYSIGQLVSRVREMLEAAGAR